MLPRRQLLGRQPLQHARGERRLTRQPLFHHGRGRLRQHQPAFAPILRHALARQKAELHQILDVERNQRGLELAIGADIPRGIVAGVVVQKQQDIHRGLRDAGFLAERAHLRGVSVLQTARHHIKLRRGHHASVVPFPSKRYFKIEHFNYRQIDSVCQAQIPLFFDDLRKGSARFCYNALTVIPRKKAQTD